jgi:hypothetical protein
MIYSAHTVYFCVLVLLLSTAWSLCVKSWTELNWTELLRNPEKRCSQIVTRKQTDGNCADFWSVFATLKNYTDRFLWSYIYQPQLALSVTRASKIFSGHRKLPDMYDDFPGWLAVGCHALKARSYIAVWQDSHTASLNPFWGQPLQKLSHFKFLSWEQYKKRTLQHSVCVSLFWTLDTQ